MVLKINKKPRKTHSSDLYYVVFHIDQFDYKKPPRKLPHQVDNSKLEIPVLNVLGMNSMGVLSPRESWGLNSL